ncbi:MAG: glycosyltransferase [Ignisphaera sp.]
MTKKILIIPANDILRHPIPSRIYHIARHLAKDYDITIFSYPNHPLGNNILRKLNAKEVTYKTIKTKDLSTYYLVNAPAMLPIMEKIIKEVDVVIHANVLPSVIATKIAKKYRKTAIYDYLDFFPQSAAAYYRGSMKSLIEKGVMLLTQEAIKNSTAIVTPSFGLALFLSRFTRKPIHVIPNGVDSDLFKPMSTDSARKFIGIDYDGPILLLYGSIDVWLNIEPLLYAVKKNRNVRLLIVGYSHAKYYYRLLEGLIRKLNLQNRVYKYPPQPYEKIPYFVNTSNIVAAPFTRGIISYATPLKIMESLACARPVITTDISEFKLWFKEGIFYYRSSQDAYELLNELTEKFDIIHNHLLKYSKLVRNRYSWKNIAETYKRVIENPYHAVSRYWYST